MDPDVIAGRYRRVREIGRGGMGTVWLGHDELLHRDVALKRLVAGSRSEREARLAGTLNHPHVVAVLDLVSEPGVDGDPQPWLVMEYVDGETLAELVRRDGPLGPDRTAELLTQVAEALEQAHRSGIIHRDVKPSNVLVRRDGVVKLTDFGIARGADDATLTQSGMVIGSPAYLAPEVVAGKLAAPASDVWSLGATAYFAMTGRPAYDTGDHVLATLHQIVSEQPPRPEKPGWLGPLFDGTLVKQPDARWSLPQVRRFLAEGVPYTDVPTEPTQAFPEILAAAAPEPDMTTVAPEPPPPEPRRRRTGLLVALLLVALLLLAGLAWLQLGGGGQQPAAHGGASASGGSKSPSPSPSRSPTTSPTTNPTGSDRVTKADIERFVHNYLATASTDPHSSWPMLSRSFQEASGGFDDYQAAWLSRPRYEVSNIVADPRRLQVSYHIEYWNPEGERTFDDDVTLQLVEWSGDLLINGEQ